jgi:GntR family transcriptional regulator
MPVYIQIANILRERIERGDWRPGDSLPSEGELSATFGVTRLTLRRATARLVDEGLLRRRRGKPAEVLGAVRQAVRARRLTGSLYEDYKGLGSAIHFKVVDRAFEKASPEVASKLRTAPQEEVLHIARVLHDGTDPLAYLHAWLPADIGRRVFRDDLEERPLIAVLREKHRIRASKSEQTIVATLADVHIAEYLTIAVGAPVLRVKALYVSPAGKPINYAIIDYRADRYEYTATLR